MDNESFAQGLLQNLLAPQQQRMSPQDIMAAMSSPNPMASVMAASVPQTTQAIGQGIRGMIGGITGQTPYSATEAYNKAMQQISQQPGFGTTSDSLTAMAQAANAVGRIPEAMQLMAQANEMKKAEDAESKKQVSESQARLTTLSTIEDLMKNTKDENARNRLKALTYSVAGNSISTEKGIELAYEIAGEKIPEPEKPKYEYRTVDGTVMVFDENGQRVGSYAASPKGAGDTEDQDTFQSLTMDLAKLDNTLDTIDEASTLVSSSNWATGKAGAIVKTLGPLAAGSDVETLEGYLNTIKANLAFDELNAMREKSKTGGALGQVSEMELTLLESAVASLDTRMRPEVLQAQLKKVQEHYNNYKNALLGKPAEIDWSNPAYAGMTKVDNGVRYFKDAEGFWWIVE